MSANAGSSDGGGESSDLKSLVIEHCTWDNVSAPRPLEGFTARRRFRIMSYDVTTFNSFNIMEKETEEDQLFRLREEILEVVEEKELRLREDPYIGEIVLAPHPGFKNEYLRAFIEKINYAPPKAWKLGETRKESTAMVYFFDVGGLHRVRLIDMKPVTKPIMKFPVLSYKIALYTGQVRNSSNSPENGAPFSSEGLIYFKKFDKLMDAFKKVDLIVQVELQELKCYMFHSTDLFNVYPAQLFYFTRKGSKCSVAGRLEREKIWEWEQTLKGISGSDQLDDNAFFKKGSYGIVADDREISTYQLSCNASGYFEFTAEVSRVTSHENSSAEVRVILLDDPVHINYRNVVHNQMERYARMVNKSIYNPAIGTRFMFKLDRKDEYVRLGVKWLDGWCRAIKLDADWIYLFDWDDSVHLRGLDSDDYDIRPLYGEFVQIPTLVVNICPFAKGQKMTYEKANATLRPGRRYRFKLKNYVESDDLHEAEYLGSVVVGGVSQKSKQSMIECSDSDSDSDTTTSSSF